jgi:hypothetical protein
MKPDELVVGNKYEAKLMRKDTKRGFTGFLPVAYEGTKDKGEDYQVWVFREIDKDAPWYSEVPLEFFADDLRKVRPLAPEPVAQHKCQFAMWIDDTDGITGVDEGEIICTDNWEDAFVLCTEDSPKACGVPTNMLWTDDNRNWYWLCERHSKRCGDLSPM